MNKLVLIIGFVFSSVILFSQTDEIRIQEIIIRGNDSTSLSRKQYRVAEYMLLMPRTAGEIFAELPGANAIKRSSFSVEPIVNGFKREQLNVMLDGGTQITHSCANRMDPMTSRISSNEVETIEIVSGPYNVRFGQTLGGIVNIITSQHSQNADSKKFGGNADFTFDTNGEGKSAGLELFGTSKFLNFGLNGTFRDFENYTAGGDAGAIMSSFTAYDYAAKVGITPNTNHNIVLSWRHSLANDVLHPGLPMDALNDDGKLAALDYSVKFNGNFLTGLKAKMYGSRVDHLMTNERRPNYKYAHTLAPVSSKTYGGRAEFILNFTDNLKVYSGFDAKYLNKDGYRARETYINACTEMPLPQVTTFTDLTWQNSVSQDFGLFAEGHFTASEKLNVNFGIRADYGQSQANETAEDFVAMYGDSINPEANVNANFFGTVSYKLSDSYKLEWSAGQGSRNPDLLEMYINHFTVGQDMYEYLGNPTLKPEINRQTNLAFGKSGHKFSFSADVFVSYISNYISAKVDSSVPRKFLPCKEPKFTKRFVNLESALQYGANASIKYHIIKGLYVSADAVYTVGENLESGEALPEIAPLTVRAALGYKTERLHTEFKVRHAVEQQNVAKTSGETETPAYSVLDFTVLYKPLKFMQIGVSAENLTDALYYNHLSRPYQNQTEGSMFYEQGRNFKMTLRFLF